MCSILRVGNIKIMLDCGCNEDLSQGLLDIIKDEARKMNYILVSHSSYIHVGALPYIEANGIYPTVIATSPVAKLGAQAMHEIYIQKQECPSIREIGPENSGQTTYYDFKCFNLKHVEKVFEKIELVSFQERKKLKGEDTEIILRAMPSGNSVGGTAWHIMYNNLSIIYAVDLNDKETPISLPLNSLAFKGANLMITNGYI